MSKRTPKNHKNSHNNPVILCWHEKKIWKQQEAMDIVSSPKVGRSLPKTIMLVVRSSGLWEAYTRTCPKWDKKIYHGMLMPLHDSMPSFMNFRRLLDLQEFKNKASQCFAGNQGCPGVWNSFPFLACTQGHRFDFSTNLYALEHVHVVQIWIMHLKCLQNQVNV